MTDGSGTAPNVNRWSELKLNGFAGAVTLTVTIEMGPVNWMIPWWKRVGVSANESVFPLIDASPRPERTVNG